jgi:acyl carrier protein
MVDLDAEIEATLRQVAGDRGRVLDSIRGESSLVRDLGFESLDLARIIAILYMKLQADPFSRLVPITSVRTVGDLQAAYAAYFVGSSQAEATQEVGFERVRERVASRTRAQSEARARRDHV